MIQTVSNINPYPGLRPFEAEEDFLFFGRERQVDALLSRLRNTHFLAVVGASGSGKSSLVRSGLLPALYRGYIGQAGSGWRVVTMRPGNDPVGNLAKALAEPGVLYQEDENQLPYQTIIKSTLKRSSKGLVEAFRQARVPKGQNLIVVVDQFEEIFRFSRYERDKGDGSSDSVALVNLLLAASQQHELPVYVVLTMRSDFIGDCAEFHGLPEAINEGQYLVPRMNRDELKAAITGPAAVAGGEISQRLLTHLLNDIGHNSDQLPILQHALMRTWNYWKSHHDEWRPVDLEDYMAVGGVDGALSQHAEYIYTQDLEANPLCSEMFKVLTDRDKEGRGIRRPTRLGDICYALNTESDKIIPIIEAFRAPGRSFLMPPVEVPLDEESIIDISHESLMRGWPRLINWVEEEAESKEAYLNLLEAAQAYENKKRDILREPYLSFALRWREKQNPTKEWAERYDADFETAMSFLRESENIIDLEKKQKEKQAFLKRVIIIGALALLVLAAFALQTYYLFKDSEESRIEAVDLKNAADSLRLEALKQTDLAKESAEEAQAERIKAEEQAEIAQRNAQRADSLRAIADIEKKRAEAAALQAQAARDSANALRILAEEASELEIDQRIKVSKALQESREATDEANRLLSLATAKSLARKSLAIQNDPQLQGLLARQAYNFYQTKGGDPFDPDVYEALHFALKKLIDENYNVLPDWSNPIEAAGSIQSLFFGPDGKLYFNSSSGLVVNLQFPHGYKLDPQLGGIRVLDNGYNFVNRGMSMSPDGNTLIAWGNQPYLWFYDIIAVSSQQLYIPEIESIYEAQFTPDGKNVLIADNLGRIFEWNIAGASKKILVQEGATIRAFLPNVDGNHLAYVKQTGELNIPTRYISYQSLNPSPPYYAMAYEADRQWIAIGNRRGSVQVFYDDASVASEDSILNFTGHTARITGLEFSPDGKRLASSSYDRTVRIWNLEKPQNLPLVLNDHKSWVTTVTFSPDGRYIFTGTRDGIIKVWPTAINELADEVCQLLNRSLEPREWATYVGRKFPQEQSCE